MDCCENPIIISVSAKCSDLCIVWYKDLEHIGYVPDGLGIGSGDYIDFDYCINCGKIRSYVFPIKESGVIEILQA